MQAVAYLIGEQMDTRQSQMLQELLQIFTIEDLQMILEHSRIVATDGYGTLSIRFHNHNPNRLEVSFEKALPKPTNAEKRRYI